ncbi:MAG: Carboxy-terminal processing protease CtpB precursor [Pelotomaculum sp. PtaB.Bin104]|nr:MAG: Carboxy-terminal processing protease CtpB precursor [Pelotomaculum sp. PtaB.Bin104]
MDYQDFRAGSRPGKGCPVLVIFILAAFLAAGALLYSNYMHAGNLVKVITLIKTQYLQPVDGTQMVDGAIKGMVNSLNDPYSVYLEPKTFSQLQEQINGSFGGLGILVGIKDQYLTVVRAYQGTPAAREGIENGDIIVKIDDRNARGIDLETAINLMRGPVGTQVRLTLERQQGETGRYEFTRTLTREEISVPTVEGQTIPGTSIQHIVVSQFTERTDEEMKEVLSKLETEPMQGIILDLRDNPGGLLNVAVEVAKNFIPSGPIVYIDYRVGREQVLQSEGQAVQLPLVVLINEGSASAAEILAGAVKDTGSGTLVGTKTFGKGIVQTVFPLEDGAGLKLTTARYLTPARNDIHEKGIQPDVEVKALEDRSRDVQLEQAVEVMRQKISG